MPDFEYKKKKQAGDLDKQKYVVTPVMITRDILIEP